MLTTVCYARLYPVSYFCMLIRDRIICDFGILGGKPVVKGTRIPLELILKLLAQGNRYEEILEEYPDLQFEDILAGIAS